MPLLLARQLSTGSLAAIVEKCQRQPSQSPSPDYELQLGNSHLDLLLVSKPPKLAVPSDEGFESDIDTISLLSSENETLAPAAPLTETDSANGGSGTESETETEKTNTLTQKNVNSIKEGLEKQGAVIASSSSRESFDLVDCICYADVNYPDVLVFVIKQEALVFKFANLEKLQTFYTNFTTLKAVANQRAYTASGSKQPSKFNLLQRTDQNGVTHIEIKKQGPTNVVSIQEASKRALESPQTSTKVKDVNTRQRTQSKLISDVKFNTVGPKPRILRSSSIENILHIDSGHLVKGADTVGGLRKVWNSAEDLLDSDSPRRPERRRKKKPAPLPPQRDKPEDVLSGQFVRVNVHVDPLQHARLVVKSTVNESHPKKLSQNFNLSGLLRASTKPQNATLNRPQRVPLYEKHHSWTNSVPRILKKSARSKSETRCSPQSLQPMPYRYIDATLDFPCQANQNNALFLSATGLKSKGDTLQRKQPPIDPIQHQPRLSFGYNVPGGISKHPMGNRVFGLTPKLKDFSRGETLNSKWGSVTDLTYLSGDRNNLKSSIKSGEPAGKKKNEKKVTFSAYTTVQVV